MTDRVFYSWQNDLPNATNRGFIQQALEKAARAIRDDESIQVEPVIDRDTSGVPGAPDIADTILEKIEQSQIFVGDVSIIGQVIDQEGKSRRPTPNPNVLIELGYAMKVLGSERIIMVTNTAFGGPELLPFDLRMKRVVTYNMPEDAEERATERKRLGRILQKGIQAILEAQLSPEENKETAPLVEQTIEAITNARANQAYLVREFMKGLTDRVEEIAPAFPIPATEAEPDELLVQTVAETRELVVEFARVAEAIALANTLELAQVVYKCFEPMLEHYDPPFGFSGHYQITHFDFYKFICHELFVTFFSFLVREEHWGLIANLLEDDFYVKNALRGQPDMVTFDYISRYYVKVLQNRNRRLKLRRVSIHADILKERHSSGNIAELVPMQEFMDTDLFLFLRSERWRPWSTLYLGYQTPKYLLKASRRGYAQKLLSPIGVEDIDALRAHLVERLQHLGQIFRGGVPGRRFLEDFDPQTIGSR